MFDEREEKITYPGFKSQVLLPILFFLTLAIAIAFVVSSGFKEDLSPFVVYFYFGVIILYIGVAIFDLRRKDVERKDFEKKFIKVALVFTFIASILYLIFYLI